MNVITAILLLVIGISFEASAQDSASPSPQEMSDKGLEFYKTKNYNEACKWFRQAADQNNNDGQNNLAIMYRDGLGVARDFVEAAKWFRLAAMQGNASSQYNLGYAYYSGRGVKKDDVEAVKWYRLAADQGHASSQENLGVMYQNGEGVVQDKIEASKWFRLAAGQGNGNAQTNLGLLYYHGDGFSKDYGEAIRWIRLAAEKGNKRAQYNLGVMYRDGLADLSQNFTKAIRWFRSSAEQGYADSQNELGLMLRKGQGVTKDEVEAMKWFRLAADQNFASSQFNLGTLFLAGSEAIRDYDEAIKWFKLAAKNGSDEGKKFVKYLEKVSAFSERVNLDSFLSPTCDCIQNVLTSSKDKLAFSIGTENCYAELRKKLISANRNDFDLSEFNGLITFGLAKKCTNWNNFHDKEQKYLNEKEESKIKNQKLCRLMREGVFTQIENNDSIEIKMTDSVQLVTFGKEGYYTKSKVQWLDDCSYKLSFIESTNPFEKQSFESEGNRIVRILNVINKEKFIFQIEVNGVYGMGVLTKKD